MSSCEFQSCKGRHVGCFGCVNILSIGLYSTCSNIVTVTWTSINNTTNTLDMSVLAFDKEAFYIILS